MNTDNLLNPETLITQLRERADYLEREAWPADAFSAGLLRQAADALSALGKQLAGAHAALQSADAVLDPEQHPTTHAELHAALLDCEHHYCVVLSGLSDKWIEADKRAEAAERLLSERTRPCLCCSQVQPCQDGCGCKEPHDE